MTIAELRAEYHARICQEIIRIQPGRKHGEYPNFADGTNLSSVKIAWEIVHQLGCKENHTSIKGQTTGGRFETITRDFLQAAFDALHHLRPGNWAYSTTQTAISGFEQYTHLAYLEQVVASDTALSAALGGDYIVKPDIVISRLPVEDAEINREQPFVQGASPYAQLTPLRKANRHTPRSMLHASISCKWTIRSDRAQNTRTEALNLIRNRKGHLPHIVAVTAEPLPTRLAALALGTGDLDCVYHFALPELHQAIAEIDNPDQLDMLNVLVDGRRLRDISDLPFDLAI